MAPSTTKERQPSLLDSPLRFDGADYTRERDDERLTVQYRRIFALMRDGRWRTLHQIEAATGDPTPSISAQLRHMRKRRFGSHTVEKRYVENGLYEYRLLVNETASGGASAVGVKSATPAAQEV